MVKRIRINLLIDVGLADGYKSEKTFKEDIVDCIKYERYKLLNDETNSMLGNARITKIRIEDI